MKLDRAVSVILLTLAVSTPAFAQSKMKVAIEATSDDRVGRQFVFHVRDQIGRSGMFAEDPSGALKVNIVTLDPDESVQGNRTIYSYTFLVSGGEDRLDSYLTSGVGICGLQKVQSCAQRIFTELGEQVETLRSILAKTKDKNF
ncbi:hypothetical protein [Caulobacter segnis]|uniref:Uncharacterized protein n=1 Tax=Caulobacter segnis TaxID=88688 RepID=A0A2W5UXJ5_9CAUL|nr:hypothetical protein [Caulobacter segnis]PZR30283.1 MAG: hypothetical protein DI526_22835 [Caulobacter segnis]